jgi:RNA polymerase primary sigma factor
MMEWDPVEAAEKILLAAQIEQMLSKLDESQQRFMRLRFGLDGRQPRTLSELAEQLDLPAERVRQYEAQIMRQLRKEGS